MMQNLPPEYAAQLEQLMRRRQLAQMLQQQSMQPQLQMVGGVAVAPSKLGRLAQMLTGLGAPLVDQKAAGGMREVLQRAQQDESAEMQSVAGMGDRRAQIAAALASRFPGIRKTGGEWQKQHAEDVRAGAKIFGDAGDPLQGVRTLAAGALPSDPQMSPMKPPEHGLHPDSKSPYSITYNRRGEPDLKFAPVASTQSVDVRLPGDERKVMLEDMGAQLKARREKAEVAVRTLDGMRSAVQALEAGAQAGGGGDILQGFRKAAQMFGVTVPETASTDEARSALGYGVLEYARKLAPVTQEDVKRLEVMVGSINTDPDALNKMLAITTAIQVRELQQFQQWHGAQMATTKDDYARQKLAGAEVGMQPPQQMFGSLPWQLRVMQELGARGGDVSQYGIGGERFAPDTQFNIGNPRLQPLPAGVEVVRPGRGRR